MKIIPKSRIQFLPLTANIMNTTSIKLLMELMVTSQDDLTTEAVAMTTDGTLGEEAVKINTWTAVLLVAFVILTIFDNLLVITAFAIEK